MNILNKNNTIGKIIIKKLKFVEYDKDILSFNFNSDKIKRLVTYIKFEDYIFLTSELEIKKYIREEKLKRILYSNKLGI